MVSVLFVCLGNICRSPAAEGVLRDLHLKQGEPYELYIESCGLGDWHVGRLPVEEMRQAAAKRSVKLSSRAQQFTPAFFERFDYILAADQSVLQELYRSAKNTEQKAKLHLITEYSASYFREEIPDPYSQADMAFELVLDMLEDSCSGILEHLNSENDRRG